MPEFARVRESSSGFVRVRRVRRSFDHGSQSGGPANNIENGTSGTLQDPKETNTGDPQRNGQTEMELDWKDRKETLEKMASTAKRNEAKKFKTGER